MHNKVAPFNYLQSRGGDSISQGGLTSATTAIGNQDGQSAENRSGHDNGGYSHKSISDHE